MLELARLRRNRHVILLFGVMVLLPVLIFGALILRAVRSEQTEMVRQRAERQQRVLHLVEADLENWLMSGQPDGAISGALFTFELQGDHIVFPRFQLSLPAEAASRPNPLPSASRSDAPTSETIATQYYPRIQAFLRDLHAGRNSGAQFFLRLGAVIVRLPGGGGGYVLEAKTLLDHVNGRLVDFCAGESFAGTLRISDFRAGEKGPIVDAFAIKGFPFFQVIFSESDPGGRAAVLARAFPYSMALLLGVMLLSSLFVYRAISQEARLSRLRTDFVSAVSHEFRTPLSSILALSERLESARIRDPEKLDEYHHVIGREARRLSALVTRLLDFAQMAEGKSVYTFERVALVPIAREAIQSCHDTGPSQRIALREESAAPLWIRADRTALRHCIQNLIENAIKYSPPDSPITVTCGSANGSSLVEVQDRGIGVPVAEQDRIFEKFYRGRQAAELNVQGVGIGLSLVKHVMESHGGDVSVESRPGEGSRFRLRLPRAEA
jgi:signal transduction histidine kinase